MDRSDLAACGNGINAMNKNQPDSPLPNFADQEWFASPAVQFLFKILQAEGDRVRIVGGAVRNSLLSFPVGDIDLATTAHPDTVIRLARAANIKVVPTGVDHGTVTLVYEDKGYEVTTLRSDIETYGRHAKVEYSDDWKEDAKRRDFTLNALYIDGDGVIHDPLNGYDDLKARYIRFIGQAKDRIREDYLRILRFYRFNGQYGNGDIDREGFLATISERQGLCQLSRERITTEFMKLLASDGVIVALKAMNEGGILVDLLGGVASIGRLELCLELEKKLSFYPSAIRRLSALAVWVEEDVERLTCRFRFSNSEKKILQDFVKMQVYINEGTSLGRFKEILYRHGTQFVRELCFKLYLERREPNQTRLADILRLCDTWSHPKFPLSGRDLISLGFRQGTDVGAAIFELEQLWIDSDFTLCRGKLLEFGRQILARSGARN